MMPYITQVSLILAGCLIFYKLLLQKETFFRINRWVLLACLALSFSLPLVPVPQQWAFQKAEVISVAPVEEPPLYDVNSYIPQQSIETPPVVAAAPEEKKPAITWIQVLKWAGWLYWFGVIVFGMNLLMQLITLLYRAYASPVIRDGRFRIVELSGDKAPCSFWNNIFLNPAKYDWETYNQILLHEKVHIEQRHSLDLLLAEVVIVFQWFNPFAWQYRKELENNLEYLTDDQLLHHPQVEKTAYQMSLLKVSAPQFPLHLTTNYNQSLLKKRIAMMNVKKSNVHTAWKYGFLLPVLVLLVCLLNKPAAIAQQADGQKAENKERNRDHGLPTEGAWFATIKQNEVSIQFRDEDNDHFNNSTTFRLSDLGDLPRDKAGIFTVSREAGTIEFSGRFEGDQGMGRYKFSANAAYADAIRKEGIELRDDKDVMVFFFVNVTQSFVKMLKANGYQDLKRNDVIPLAALKVDAPWIESIKKSGIGEISVHNLIPLKALNITGDYISEIRKAGYPNITANQLISFKSQGIDAKYIADVRAATGTVSKPAALTDKKAASGSNEKEDVRVNADVKTNVNTNVNVNTDVTVNDIVAIKSLNINPEYIRSLKEAGLDNLSNSRLIAMKSQGITADYIKELRTAGFKDLSANDIISFKSQNITPDYARSLKEAGLPDISNHQLVSMKSQDITAGYIKELQAAGFKDLSANDIVSIKSQNITPDYARSLKEAGFSDLKNHQLVSMKSMGITADYIKELKAAGFKEFSANDAVAIKSQNITPEFVKGFEALGYKDISARQAVSLKALNVTADYIKGFQDIGFKDVSLQNAVSLKSQNITPSFVSEYKKLGFDDISLHDVISAKATGTTPAFIASMKEKGHNLKSLNKYIQLKTIVN